MPDRTVSPYGPEYEQLLLRAFADLPFSLPVKNSGLATAMRAKVYGYFRQLREENLCLDLIEMADSITICREGATLIFKWKKDMWDAQLLREALDLPEDFDTKATAGDGKEFRAPDILGTRLTKQLELIRARKANPANIVPPMKSVK